MGEWGKEERGRGGSGEFRGIPDRAENAEEQRNP